MTKYILLIYLVWNVITFLMMGIDKRKAIKDARRISEKTLLLSAFIMGAVGSILGSLVFHHKTQKAKFRILLPIALVVNIAVFVLPFLWKHNFI